MSNFLYFLLLPNLKTAASLTFVLTLIICFGTLTSLPKMIEAPWSDKWYHFIAFATLTYPLVVASRWHWLMIIFFSLFLGASIEIIQPYVNRLGETADFTTDALGVLVGFSLGVIGHFLKLKFDNR